METDSLIGRLRRCGIAVIILSATAGISLSCGTVELERPDTGGMGHHANDSVPLPTPGGTGSLYVTGVEYPDGYDWKTDTEYGNVACTVFLMKDGERIVELDVDGNEMVASDADMHRCYGGHLYTDYSTETETVIKSDGTELFRYPDREMIVGLEVVGDDVYTLGVPRIGDGWTLRKNGKMVLVKTSGYVLSPLAQDDGVLWFAYVEQISAGDGVLERYYLVRGDKAEPVGARPDMKKIEDILLYDGVVYYAALLEGLDTHTIFKDEESALLDAGSAAYTSGCRIHYDGGDVIYVSGIKHYDTSGDMWTLWKDYALMKNYQSSVTLHSCYADGDALSYVLTDRSDGTPRLRIFDKTAYVDLDSEGLDACTFLGNACGCAHSGHLYVALHPAKAGDPPVIVKDGVPEKYDFNGYFTSVSVW